MCKISPASLSLELAFILSLICLFSPFWVISEYVSSKTSIGLLLGCSKPVSYWNCEFYNFKVIPDWLKGCTILWIIGTALVTIVVFARRIRTISVGAVKVYRVLSSIAATCFAISTIVFGINYGDIFSRDGLGAYYAWTFYLTWVSIICTICMALFLSQELKEVKQHSTRVGPAPVVLELGVRQAANVAVISTHAYS